METANRLAALADDLDIGDLMQEARKKPAEPVLEGLLNAAQIGGLHGPQEVFKTIFCMQLAESLARGEPFLDLWNVPHPFNVYFLETEMSTGMMGARLLNMYGGKPWPHGIRFANEARMMEFRRAPDIEKKFGLLAQWVQRTPTDVLIIDTCNPFFRRNESASDEGAVGLFFDLLADLPVPTKFFVRHNRKTHYDPKGHELLGENPAEEMRGSKQFSEVPDRLLRLRRKDSRTHEAILSVSKNRHGSKWEGLNIWFDLDNFRLTAIPPVMHLLRHGPKTRGELIAALERRFDVSERMGDALILQVSDHVSAVQHGHEKLYTLDPQAISFTLEQLTKLVRIL